MVGQLEVEVGGNSGLGGADLAPSPLPLPSPCLEPGEGRGRREADGGEGEEGGERWGTLLPRPDSRGTHSLFRLKLQLTLAHSSSL